MKNIRVTVFTSLAALCLLAAIPYATADQTVYAWKTPTPGGAPPGKPLEVIHGSPRNLTEYDVYLRCSPGSSTLSVAVVTPGFGPYKPENVEGQAGNAIFIIDGRALPARTMKLTASDLGIEASGEFENGAPLLRAFASGKKLQVELPRIKTRQISLRGAASLLAMMRKHCTL